MKNLVLLFAVLCTVCLNAYGQRADVATYELVERCGTVSVYALDNEFRMVVGPVHNPKASLLLGMLPETAASQFDRISKMGEKDFKSGERRVFLLCGEPFLFNASGAGENRRYSFRGITSKIRFSLTEAEVQAIKNAILEKKN